MVNDNIRDMAESMIWDGFCPNIWTGSKNPFCLDR